MKNFLKATALCSLLVSFGFAYSANGDLKVTYTGYKTQKKVGVPGTFKTIKLTSSENANFADFAKSLNVEIDGGSVDTKMKIRDVKIAGIFTESQTPQITAKILDVKGDEKAGTFSIEINMNKNAKTYDFPYSVENNQITAKGKIDILEFAMNKSFDSFAKKCKALHSGKTWSEVGVEFKLPIK